MIVHRPSLLACLLLLGTTSLSADAVVEADPHELLERAEERLSGGDLRGCAAEISRLRALLARSPRWDPEGEFSDHLLPPIAAALSRLEGAAGRLDEFERRALRDLEPPDPGHDMDTVGDYTRWATSVIERLRVERDGIIRAALADPTERGILTRTESYARTERLLEVEILMKMADAAGDEVVGLLSGDPDIESILVRYRQLRQDLIQVAAERDRLQQDLRESEERWQGLLEALATVVTDGGSIPAGPDAQRTMSVGDRFSRFLDAEREALARRPSIGPAERDLLRSRLERYRRYDQALLAAGLGPGRSESLRALTQVVEEIPASEESVAAPPSRGWTSGLLVIALVSGAGLLARLTVLRRRRRLALRRPLRRDRRQDAAVLVGDKDAGRDAA